MTHPPDAPTNGTIGHTNGTMVLNTFSRSDQLSKGSSDEWLLNSSTKGPIPIYKILISQDGKWQIKRSQRHRSGNENFEPGLARDSQRSVPP